jgi:hypothetical protein
MAIKIAEKFIKGDNLYLTNVRCKWAHVHEPDRKFEPAWTITAVLDDKTAGLLKDVGFNVRQDGDNEWVLKIKKKERTKAGKTMEAPKVIDKGGMPFTEAIGNGSVVSIKVFAKYQTVSGRQSCAAYLDTVQVIDHVPYTPETMENAPSISSQLMGSAGASF